MTRSRIVRAALIVAVVTAVGVSLGGCAKRVKVRTGTRVVCTYGHVVKDDVRTIEVKARDASRYSVETSSVVCALHASLSSAYDKAQTAIGKGDLMTARKLLESVVAKDPGFRSATRQLTVLRAGRLPERDTEGAGAPGAGGSGGSASGGSGGGGPAGGNGGGGSAGATSSPEGPIVALTKYVPDALDGYKAQAVEADALSLSRAYLPTDTRETDQLVIAAEQFSNATMAKRGLAAYRSSYGADGSDEVVMGKTAYFGTAGSGLAVVAFVDGSIVVAAEMHAVQGKDPASLRADLLRIAQVVAR